MPTLRRDVLTIDAARETERIVAALRGETARKLRRRGAVVALSGGVDSSVVGALCVRAFGADRVFRDIDQKRAQARILLMPPLLVEDVELG
jgi:NH3-dependent NAD+ synthetase